MAGATTFVAADADGYEALMGRWSRRLAEPFLDFAGPVAGAVLDAGCGTGALSEALAARHPGLVLTGIDLAEPYVARAAARVPDGRFLVGDVCATGLPAAAFDAALSLLVLHFVPAPAEALAEMRRVLRPGAPFAAAVWDVRGGMVINRMFYDTAAAILPEADERRARNYMRPLTRPGELAGALREAGFADVEEAMLTIRMEYESFEALWRALAGRDGPVAQLLIELGEEKRERVSAALRRAYVDGAPDGPRSYAAVAFAAKGRAPG